MSEQRSSRLSRRALGPAFELAASQVADGTVPYVILGIADAAGVVRVEAFGPRDGQRIGVDAVCLLASITKPIVTTAVLHEVETGRLDLAEPLLADLPGLAGADRQPFGTWHVLTHTCGIGDVDIEALLARGGDRAELLRCVGGAPGHAAGIDLPLRLDDVRAARRGAGAAAGPPFEDLVRGNVLAPLGMSDTVWAPTAARRAGWRPSPSTCRRSPASPPGISSPATRACGSRRRAVEHGRGHAPVRAGDAPRRRAR